MKVQYGIDTSIPPDGTVDCWTPASNGACGNWTAANVQSDTFPQKTTATADPSIERMIAVRVGIVVRSDEPDLKDPALVAGTRAPVVLFNCSSNNPVDPLCANRIVVAQGAAASFGGSNCAPAVICDQWRYRTYETVIPLRNTIYLATVPGASP